MDSQWAIAPGRIIKTRIQIESPLEMIWRELTDFPSYAQWNPFFRSVSGEPRSGTKLALRVSPPESPPLVLSAEVLRVIPYQELRWLGYWLSPGVVDWEHRFLLEAQGPQMTFLLQRAVFRGLAIPFLWSPLRQKARQGMEAMSEALKQRAEGTIWA